MERRQPLSRRRRKGYVAPVAVSLLGVGLIQYALLQPLKPLPTPALRQVALAASARGASVYAGRQAAAIEEKALSAEFQSLLPSWAQDGYGQRAENIAATLAQVPSGRGGPEGVVATTTVPAAMAEAKVAPPTPIPPRTGIIVYKVVAGDNPWAICQRFGISEDTLIWANPGLEADPSMIQIDQELNILPISGVWHTVKAGETLQAIAERYNVDVKKITGYEPNGLTASSQLVNGQKLIIPDGVRSIEEHVVYTPFGAQTITAHFAPGQFIWPDLGWVTTECGPGHYAIDIANSAGMPLYATAAGTVTYAGWDQNGGMGLMVHIVHEGGWESEYGHLSELRVKYGDKVTQAQVIGLMGSTGKSTGPHVHFILSLRGYPVSPRIYLPRR